VAGGEVLGAELAELRRLVRADVLGPRAASLGAWEQRACSVAGRNLTRAEWAQFVAGPAYKSVCP
jgi:hypothetical protein